MTKKTILISSCLLGIPCRYDGQLAKRLLKPSILDRINLHYHVVPVCPEQLAGLPTPRTPVEIREGDGFSVLDGTARVETEDGKDFTGFFIRGGRLTLQIARLTGAVAMVCTQRSPSCSCENIYDGSFSSVVKPGNGVCTALLKREGIRLIDIDVFEKEFETESDSPGGT